MNTAPPSPHNPPGGARPSLSPTSDARATSPAQAPASLIDLMYDGFYLLFLLRSKHPPTDATTLRDNIKQFLTQFERHATRLGAAADDIFACKYAYCATVDEVVLMSPFKVRDAWQRQPLQLQFFGEQLAGEQFFVKLEELRRQGQPRLQVLEVFHMCLLLGFQGKYLIEGSEKLGYLTSRLGDEIAHLKGKRAAFAPHWAAPDRIAHQLRHELPLWAVASVFALLALTAFVGLRWHLGQHTRQALTPFENVVQLAPQVAHITITLP